MKTNKPPTATQFTLGHVNLMAQSSPLDWGSRPSASTDRLVQSQAQMQIEGLLAVNELEGLAATCGRFVNAGYKSRPNTNGYERIWRVPHLPRGAPNYRLWAP